MPIHNAQTLKVLQKGEINLKGEFVWGSNYTFLVEVVLDGDEVPGVYKPARGERPLWDFPRASLAHREVAAYLVSEALDWALVPPTVYRPDGPAGAGSIQLFIDHDPEYHYFNFTTADRLRLKPTVLFDYLINNADRKGSHVLVDPDNHIWLIDHGICFHEEDKLRTVIWDFCGDPIPDSLLQDMESLAETLESGQGLSLELQAHLTPVEIKMLGARANWLIKSGYFPNPPSNRRANPWPPL